MPRKDFQRDLAKASAPGVFAHLDQVRSGDDDGSIYFTYTAPSDAQHIDLQVSVPDTSEYPNAHTYFAFAATDVLPEVVSSALEQFQPADCTLTVLEFLEYLSGCLDTAILNLSSSSDPMDLDEDEDEDDADETSLLSDDEIDWDDEEVALFGNQRDFPTVISEMRADLRPVKEAGYKVGYLGHVTGSVIISISRHISKLGISYEAMKAWNVSPSDYLVLLIRYPQGYARLEDILAKTQKGFPSGVEMHVGTCEMYKPSAAVARRAFDSSPSKQPSDDNEEVHSSAAQLKSIFIGNSLQTLLNGHLIDLLTYRLDHGFSWTGAELFLNNSQGRIQDQDGQEPLRSEYQVDETWDESAPAFLKADHVSDAKWNRFSLSFPLVAMQFTLRRFVKCVDFCLNCYCKVDSDFEALKPYVCSKGLCLYQYMKLGMGPSLEWEILSQPYVVDVLISFAYARASAGYLSDFPNGLGLRVPPIQDTKLPKRAYVGKFDSANMQLEVPKPVNLKAGDWIVMTRRDEAAGDLNTPVVQFHCRVMSTVFAPLYELATPVPRTQSDSSWVPHNVQFVVYSADFDSLEEKEKRETLCMLLDTLPGVDLMRSFMTSGHAGVSERSLATWTERISPAALYVLRWIVASNRSCIMHEENPEHRVSGVGGYMQFRLAQGAPDKEHRFVHAVRTTARRLDLKHPTLFAWHGSPLHNWHSILREGLHFKFTAHGRAYGHGVYMAPSFGHSLTYSSRSAENTGWPHSILKVSHAVALNEVVNAPAEFIESRACYVVDQIDWIQPRYLFVHCLASSESSRDAATGAIYEQDPNYTAQGVSYQPIIIPLSALCSRRNATASSSPTKKAGRPKRKRSGGSRDDEDDSSSVVTLLEDRMLLDWGTEEDLHKRYAAGDFANGQRRDSSSQTDFRPGSLQEDSVKLLGQPQYATSQATRILQQHLQSTLKAQERAPLHELGWYINSNLIENVYQWIVELHSFDARLPLAKDLKTLGLTSVVLELRFPPEFPMSPPFVRVIRPRFVMFSQGGGGHVTAGGALCMELLTTSGWSPVSSIESVLLQVRMAIMSTEPRPARLELSSYKSDYSVGEAIEAYVRFCNAHGWQVPADISRISWA